MYWGSQEKNSSRRLSEGQVQQLAWKAAVILMANFMKLKLATSSKDLLSKWYRHNIEIFNKNRKIKTKLNLPCWKQSENRSSASLSHDWNLMCTSAGNFWEKVLFKKYIFCEWYLQERKKKRQFSVTVNKSEAEMQFGASDGNIISQSRECSYFFY